jgi:DNA-binding helix-hairpin-helix protein with protein kinase domain
MHTTSNNQPIQLGRELGRGGEGSVHEVAGQSVLVAKLYHPQHRTPAREAKLRAMLANPPLDNTRAPPLNHISLVPTLRAHPYTHLFYLAWVIVND